MRKFFLVSFVLSAMLAVAGASFALEKTRVLDNSADDNGWAAGSTCSIVYWNRCTLWGFSWSGFGEKAVIGVCADNCCTPEQGVVTETRHWFFTNAPAGYGFTGTVALSTVDANCCPNGTLASQPFLPAGFPGIVAWAQVVPAKFAVVMTLEDGTGGLANPAGVATDHPSAGPTGPQACGFCYPLNRVNHSFGWGTTTTPACPGSTFNDGVCDAQLRWSIFMACHPVSVEASSWGAVKNLYR